jgi:hypothetical protein
MPITGFDFDRLFFERVDKAYNSYKTKPQRINLYKQAVYYTVENIYNRLRIGGQYDEIRSMIATNFPIVPVNDEVSIPNQLSDYAHYLFARAEFHEDSPSAVGFYFMGGGTVTMVFSQITNLRTGSFVEISNQQEIPQANGRFYLKRIGRMTYELYLDKDLKQKVTTNVFSGSTADITTIILSDCTMQFSDQRIGELIKPTKRNPKVQVADNALKIEPSDCKKLVLDYVKIPPVLINPDDNTFDLETVYSTKLIYEFVEKAAEIFTVQTRDIQSFQTAINEQRENP